jgi:signal transduction histidine kinase
MPEQGSTLRSLRQSFRNIATIAQADAGLVVARPVVPDADTAEILAEFGDTAIIEAVRQFLVINRWPLIPGGITGFEPSVWRVSPSHELWLPLVHQDQAVGLLFLAYQAPRQWTGELQRQITRALDDLTVDVALWRSHVESQIFRGLVAQSQDGIALMDDQGRIVYANSVHRRLKTRLGNGVSARRPGWEQETLTPLIENGKTRWLHNRFFPVVLPDGLVYQAVIQRDVTESRQLMQQVEQSNRDLRAMNEQLKKAQVARQTFLAMVTHELKTPLHLMMGALDTVKRLRWDSPEEIWTILQDSAKQLELLIDDLLTVTRLQTGSLAVLREPVDIVREVEQCVLCWKGADPRLEYEPPTQEVPVVAGDARRLRQILDNVIGNGLAYCQTRVSVRVGRDRQAIVVTVSDDGPGIPEADRTRIFEPFYRGTGARPGGMGLGLAVAKGLAEAQGGRLTVTSSASGSSFQLILPYRPKRRRTVRYRWAAYGAFRIPDRMEEINA